MISDVEVVVRLLLAVVLAGLVGLERESKGREAGFRTHILVCMGSTLVMLTGLNLVGSLHAGGVVVDPTRMAAQVVTGVGFLGAGAIIRTQDSIRGLTTAAGLWAAAGIGLAVGSGFYVGAVAATLIVLIALFSLSSIEQRIRSRRKTS